MKLKIEKEDMNEKISNPKDELDILWTKHTTLYDDYLLSLSSYEKLEEENGELFLVGMKKGALIDQLK